MVRAGRRLGDGTSGWREADRVVPAAGVPFRAPARTQLAPCQVLTRLRGLDLAPEWGPLSRGSGACQEGKRAPVKGFVKGSPEPGPAVERALGQGVVTDCVLTLRAADGHETAVSINAANFTDPRGETQGLLASIRDLTVSREIERQQREAQKMEAIGRLAGSVGHEFKNLLTVVNVYAGLLEADIPVEDPRHASVEEILGAGERATALLRQLLTLGRREAGEPVLVDVAGLVAQLTPMFRHLAGETVDLQARAEPGLGPVRCDPAQLEELLVNLVSNACDAMPTGGVLTIEMRPLEVGDTTAVPAALARGRYVRLDVADTGVGMDAATLERIFEPFFTTKPVGRGTGLGLAAVYGTVRQLGGAIAASSQPGQGTTFTICLPVATALETGTSTV